MRMSVTRWIDPKGNRPWLPTPHPNLCNSLCIFT